MSISEVSPEGTSCATCPIRWVLGQLMLPSSIANSPVINFRSVVLPVPLRPTIPTLCPEGMAMLASDIKRRPSIR